MRTHNRHRILSIVDFNSIYQEAADRGEAIILDKIDFSQPGYSDILAENLYSRSADIDFVSKCECGNLTGNQYDGRICPRCKTVASKDMEAADGHLRHRVFISCPDTIPGWLHPHIYRILAKWLTYEESRHKVNLLDNILDVTVPLHPDLEGIVDGRGFTWLYHNYDKIIDYFLHGHRRTMERAKTNPETGASAMKYCLALYRDRVFCRYLPVLASALHPIIMDDGVGPNRKRFEDKNTKNVLAAINGLSYLRYSPRHRHLRYEVVEETAFAAYKNHIEYLVNISTTSFSSKKSIPRQHIFGNRMHLTGRAVITPIVGEHDYDTIFLPWQLGVNNLRPHILGRLMIAHGYDPAEAIAKHQRALLTYDPDIDGIMQDLIRECPYKGLPYLVNRNPSLKRGSVQLLFCPQIKPDPHDKAIEISNIVTADPNADERFTWCD